jgi:DNA-binding transcriptional MerR regulator
MSEILAFTADNVCRLTGLSGRQLRYWDATDFFSPELLDEYKQRAFGRIYSFRDVVGLRTIAVLRNLHRIPLQELRRVGEWLQVHHESPWSTLRFALSGRKVVFADPGTQHYLEATGGGQSVMQIALEPIASEMRQAAQQLRERSTEQFGSVLRKRYVVQNAWVLAGTRIPTQAVWNFHQAGFSPEAIIHEYPRLTPVDVKAAIEFEASRKRAV